MIDAILKHFGLPRATAQRTLAAVANDTYLVQCADGQEVVLKRLRLQQKELLANELAVQAQLRAAGIATPTYLAAADGGRLYDRDAVQAVASYRLAGIHPLALNDAFCIEIGRMAARFHGAVRVLPIAHWGWLNPAVAKARLGELSDTPEVNAAKRLIVEHQIIYAQALPTGIIHGDLHENNVLVRAADDPTIVAVMDFEEAEINLLVVDLARTILSVCRDEKGTALLTSRIDHVVRGYEQVRRLTVGEQAALPSAIRYVVAMEVIWLHRHGFAIDAGEHLLRASGPF